MIDSVTLQLPADPDEEILTAGRKLLIAITEREPTQKELKSSIPQRDGGAVAIIGLILAVPGAIQALIAVQEKIGSFKARRELRDRIEPTFETLKKDQSVVLKIGEKSITIADVTIDQLLDAIFDSKIGQKPE